MMDFVWLVGGAAFFGSLIGIAGCLDHLRGEE